MLKDLVDISRYYGANPDYVIAGGGNTSYKNELKIWVKASGIALETIDEEGFVCLSREKLKVIEGKRYSSDATTREQEVKNDLSLAVVDSSLRPSVETSLHNIIDYAYVVHTHPTKLNALLCSNSARSLTKKFFGERVLFVEYTDPGYILFKKILDEIDHYRAEHHSSPQIIFLENHGVFVAADSTEEIKDLYEKIMVKVEPPSDTNYSIVPLENDDLQHISDIPELRKKSVLLFTGELIRYFLKKEKYFAKISAPFTPDHIVYCKSKYLYLDSGKDPDRLSDSIKNFRKKYGYDPKVIAVADLGLITIEESLKSAKTVFEVYYDLMKISWLSALYGGPKFMTPEQIEFIDNWEVENYRRKVASA